MRFEFVANWYKSSCFLWFSKNGGKQGGKKIIIEFNNSSVPSSRSNKSEWSTESDRLKVHFLLPQTCDGVWVATDGVRILSWTQQKSISNERIRRSEDCISWKLEERDGRSSVWAKQTCTNRRVFIGRSEKQFISSPTTDDLSHPTAIITNRKKQNKLEPHVNRADL